MIELIDLRNWKKQKNIILELHREYGINITPREWRSQVEKWNKKWAKNEVNYCITHSNKGFKATTNIKEARIAINDFQSRINQMRQRKKDIMEGFKERKLI